MPDSIKCDRCDQEFTDEEAYKIHMDIDHGASEADSFQFIDSRNAVDEQEFVEDNGVRGYNPNPNAGLYDNKLFRVGSSTERTSILGEAEFGDYDVKCSKCEGSGKDGDEDCDRCNGSGKIEWNSYVKTESDTAYKSMKSDLDTLKGLGDYNPNDSDDAKKVGMSWQHNQESYSREDFAKAIDDCPCNCANCAMNYHSRCNTGKCVLAEARELGDTEDRITKSHVNQFDKILNVLEDEDLAKPHETLNILDQLNVSESEVDYDKEDKQTMGFIEQQHTEPKEDKDKELDDVDISLDEIEEVYTTKASEVRKKSYTTEAKMIEALAEEYDDFEDSDEEEITETITLRKLGGYSEESIAKELHITYGVSHDEALEKVYSVEVSNNDKVAQTFFGKMYKECTESEKAELRMYSGSD